MLAQDRYDQILEQLAQNHSVKVSRLIKQFGVSIETVRRDLEHLESQGLLKRVHGGAVAGGCGLETTRSHRQNELMAQKREIGEILCSYIQEGDSIAMDASTTNHAIAQVLKSHFKRLTVLTNYIPIMQELSAQKEYTIIVPGGIVNNEELSITGDFAEYTIPQFRIHKMLLSMSGISLKDGLTDFGFQELPVKKKMMEISRELIVVADSSKFGIASLFKVCDFTDINMIVTDSGLKENVKQEFFKQGIEIVNRSI